MKYPMLLEPVYKDYIWGGTNLLNEKNRLAGLEKIAEIWELACHEQGTCGVLNGEYAGRSLDEVLASDAGILGANCGGRLPLLIKLLDAKEWLSVQVHPDNEYAFEHEGCEGKSELWYVQRCEEGAGVYFGFNKNVDKEEFTRRAKDGTIEKVLNKIHVKKGDMLLVEPGTVHAIGAGITMVEIGENSNITYRIFDYGRKDADGNERPLHIEKAADIMKRAPERGIIRFEGGGEIICGSFSIKRKETAGLAEEYADESSFAHILCIEGSGSVAANGVSAQIEAGSSVLVPAGTGKYEISGDNVVFITSIV